MSEWTHKHLLDLTNFSKEELTLILETAKSFKEVSSRDVKKVPALRGKSVATLFFEPSTRTRASFELAAKRLSADTLNIAASISSITKGESILDTARNIEAMNIDCIIVRHQSAGVPHILANGLKSVVINAGDGCRSHPTQALLDLYTMYERFGDLKGLHVGIVGDIKHSRVARSNVYALKTMGADVTLCGPNTLMPVGIETLGANVTHHMDDVLENCDVIMGLRLQNERQQDAYLPSIKEYAQMFSINQSKLEKAKKDVMIMHPGPTNRGVEVSAAVADGEKSVILEQVTNGIAVRMAVLYLLLGKKQ